MKRRNPDVARRPVVGDFSESGALGIIRELAAGLAGQTRGALKDDANTIRELAEKLLDQLRRGTHVNPPLTTFIAANPPNGRIMSHDVQLLAYRHVRDGNFYVHTFGGKDDDTPIDKRGGRQLIYLDSLPAKTGVDMRASSHIVQLSRPDGKPLSEDF